jgi:hypothetical protein
MLLNESTAFGTRTCIVSPRTEINWDVETNDGEVRFHLERLSTKRMPDGSTFIVERYFEKVLTVPISTVVGRDYEGTPGMTIMAGLKSATRAAYDASAVTPDPDADPIAPYVAIVRDPINGGGSVTFSVEDRGVQLGTMVASVGELLSPALLALIDAATDQAIGEAL